MKKVSALVALLGCLGVVTVTSAGTPSPEVYGFRVDRIGGDDNAYHQGSLYLLTGPDGKEQYIIVRDVSGAVAVVKREPAKIGKQSVLPKSERGGSS